MSKLGENFTSQWDNINAPQLIQFPVLVLNY